MSNYQTKQSIVSLLQSSWSLISQLNWSDAKAQELAAHFDAVLDIMNDKMKDVTAPDQVKSVDPDRRQKREKKDEKKDGKE